MTTTDDILKEMDDVVKRGYGTKDYDSKCNNDSHGKDNPYAKCMRSHGL